MDLKLSDEQLKALVTEALFIKLDPEVIKQMVTDALGLLMVPAKNDYGRPIGTTGRLQSAVEDVLLKVARGVCETELAKTEIKDRIATLVNEAIERVTVHERDKTVDAMARQTDERALESSRLGTWPQLQSTHATIAARWLSPTMSSRTQRSHFVSTTTIAYVSA